MENENEICASATICILYTTRLSLHSFQEFNHPNLSIGPYDTKREVEHRCQSFQQD